MSGFRFHYHTPVFGIVFPGFLLTIICIVHRSPIFFFNRLINSIPLWLGPLHTVTVGFFIDIPLLIYPGYY